MPDETIFNKDDYKINHLKHILYNMPEDDKSLLLLYIELGNLRDVAKILNVSHTLVFKEINKIRNKYFSEI